MFPIVSDFVSHAFAARRETIFKMGGLQGPLHYITHQFNSTHINAQRHSILHCCNAVDVYQKNQVPSCRPLTRHRLSCDAPERSEREYFQHTLYRSFSRNQQKSLEIYHVQSQNVEHIALNCLIANKTAEDLADLADSVLAGRTWPALFGARMDRFLKQTVQSLSSHCPVTVKKNALILLISF